MAQGVEGRVVARCEPEIVARGTSNYRGLCWRSLSGCWFTESRSSPLGGETIVCVYLISRSVSALPAITGTRKRRAGFSTVRKPRCIAAFALPGCPHACDRCAGQFFIQPVSKCHAGRVSLLAERRAGCLFGSVFLSDSSKAGAHRSWLDDRAFDCPCV